MERSLRPLWFGRTACHPGGGGQSSPSAAAEEASQGEAALVSHGEIFHTDGRAASCCRVDISQTRSSSVSAKVWEHLTSPQLDHLSHRTVETWEGAAFRGPSVPWKEAPAVACALMSEQAEEEPSPLASASSFPLFNAPFIHLQDAVIPTLFQPHIKSRHALLSHGSLSHSLAQVCRTKLN